MLRAEVEGANSAICGGGGSRGIGRSMRVRKGTGGLGTGVPQNWGDDLVDKVRT